MIEIDVNLPADWPHAQVPEKLEQACAGEGLIMAMRGTLSTYPGCEHWHFKKPGQKGTLEATYWGKTRRLWFKIADGRDAPWVRPAIDRLKAVIEKAGAEAA